MDMPSKENQDDYDDEDDDDGDDDDDDDGDRDEGFDDLRFRLFRYVKELATTNPFILALIVFVGLTGKSWDPVNSGIVLRPVSPEAQGSTLKGNASATALKAAANATLADTGGYLGGNTTMKLSQGLANKTMLPNKNVTMLKSIDTVWDEEPDDQKMYEQRKKLKSLAVRVDRMAGVFDEETRARQEQRTLMDDLHNEQMKRIDEIGEELDQAMAELAAYIVEFMRRFRKQLHDTFTALFSDLQEQVERLRPRLAALEARGRVLDDGIQEERKERMKQYSEILDPVKVQIAKLEQGLIREQQIRQVLGPCEEGILDPCTLQTQKDYNPMPDESCSGRATRRPG
ncbi:hypothetical protein AK812_SmicGene25349 [Symbiodinium microadriaticum]|uniref:Uncharacterized protein n=1 Tax=Symbiodinium microadriaticum TaxID=2951 RepID=A0A1Q9DCA3_SYMMI|nr:hypothetical protein AK812_SmicGene25349 [Symbiodinium microadriaticum]